jgi:hypothetical protein
LSSQLLKKGCLIMELASVIIQWLIGVCNITNCYTGWYRTPSRTAGLPDSLRGAAGVERPRAETTFCSQLQQAHWVQVAGLHWHIYFATSL